MDRFLRMNAAGMGMGQGAAAPTDAPVVDTAEQVYISSLALLKMLKHGRAGKRCLKLEGSVFSIRQKLKENHLSYSWNGLRYFGIEIVIALSLLTTLKN